MPSPYEVLQVDPDADPAEIDRAYRRRVKEAHPDQGGSPRAFQLVRAAYEELAASDGPPDEFDAVEEPQPARDARVDYVDYDLLAENGLGFDDADLFDAVSDLDRGPPACGRFLVKPDETLLQAAENRGFDWPYSCRGGACANCAVAVTRGELSMPVNHVLPDELLDRGVRLSCVGRPVSEELEVVFNLKHLPVLDELRLPPRPFEST